MKYIIILLTLTLGACSSKPSFDERAEHRMDNIELAGFYKHGFCEGEKLRSYFESTRYTHWVCWNGGSFMIRNAD